MKLNALVLAGALAVVSGWAQAQAVDPLQVRSWAAACASCHGTSGVAQAGTNQHPNGLVKADEAGTDKADQRHRGGRG